MRLAIANPEASEPFDDAHPRARHTGDVQALVGLVVVIVQVKPCCAQVHFYGLGLQGPVWPRARTCTQGLKLLSWTVLGS